MQATLDKFGLGIRLNDLDELIFYVRDEDKFWQAFIHRLVDGRTSDWVVEKQRGACGQCQSDQIDMLFPRSGPDLGPGFVICHACHHIAKIDKFGYSGPIERIDDDGN